MQIYEVTNQEYTEIVKPKVFFDTVFFNELNAYKVNAVRYFVFKDKKYRFGICMGQTQEGMLAPFSAPFSMFEPVHAKWSLEELEEAIQCLNDYAIRESWQMIRFVLAPYIYNSRLVPLLINVLLRHKYMILYHDLNYVFNLNHIDATDYIESLPPNGRKNLKLSLSNKLTFKHCDTLADKKCAYQVIKKNREERGFPLRMTWNQVADTIKIIPHDFFLVLFDNVEVAAAQVFYVTDKICQVVYWGSIIAYNSLKPINFLAYKLIQYYGQKEMRYIDIGPSSEEGIPNYGLCSFKTSVGCEVCNKFTFLRKFK